MNGTTKMGYKGKEIVDFDGSRFESFITTDNAIVNDSSVSLQKLKR